MTPDPLENILKDVKNDDIHQKIEEYKANGLQSSYHAN